MAMELKEFCYRCQQVTDSRAVSHIEGTEYRCAACGWQVDFVFDDDYEPNDEDDNEPIGSCDNCDTNIYPSEDDGSGLCDQCQWWAQQ